MRLLFLAGYLLGFSVCGTSAQDTTRTNTAATIRFTGYAEIYYSYDMARPLNHERPEFLYNHKRHNEVNANLLLLQGEYERDGVRGAVGLMAGTYAQYNLAHEPLALRNIYEARVGMRLAKRRELWVDAGIFPSHIGFETVIGLENQTLTRSIVAENSPYYEAGVMLSYHPNDRWMLAGLVLNGWQRIQRPGQTRPV
ncbi:MAG: porin [Bacteroidota bacterium]|nr:porin [Bacteroidota bacterium]